MTLVRPTFVLATISGMMPSRGELALYGIQLVSRGDVVWAKKAAWFRNPPFTAMNPTAGQLDIRIRFGNTAKEVARMSAEEVASAIGGRVVTTRRGGKLIETPDGLVLPKVAAYLHAKKLGKSPYAEGKHPATKRSLHTLEELKKMAEKILKVPLPAR